MTERHIFWRKWKDRIFLGVLFALSLLLIAPLVMIGYYIVKQGVAAMSWDFLTKLPVPVGVTGGGIANAIMGSLYLIMIAVCVAVPWGVLAGVYLYDMPNTKVTYWIRLSVDILQAIPSIVIGIVAYVWFVLPLKTFSALSGGLALGIMMLPLVVRATEETLRMLPKTLKEAALALGVPYYRTLFRVVLPSGLSGIMTGILLGASRICGETAPLLFTAFGSSLLIHNILKPMSSLPAVIFNYAMSPYDEWHDLAWAASLLLVLFIGGMNLLVKVVVRKWSVKF